MPAIASAWTEWAETATLGLTVSSDWSAWVETATVSTIAARRFDGEQWVNLGTPHRFDGEQWVPLAVGATAP